MPRARASLESSSISPRDSSRASVTREAPKRAAASIPAMLCVFIWVEMCRRACGSISRSAAARPMSCTMNASTPARYARHAASSAARTSSGSTAMFIVTYTRAPRRWAYAHASASVSAVKLSAPRRALNDSMPRYTASAPALTAACSAAMLPAGARSSTPHAEPVARPSAGCVADAGLSAWERERCAFMGASLLAGGTMIVAIRVASIIQS